jgi:tetratricopeptide (TPR) repeat protein
MNAPSGQVALGPFFVDMVSTRLVRDGTAVELRPQAFSALRTLMQHSGQFVNYEDMLREAWDGVRVSRHTVAVTVGEVKKVLQEGGCHIHYRPKLGYRLEVRRAESLIRTGWHFWIRQTREGLDKALDCFQRAALEDGSDFRAFHGISFCYLLLGTYGMRPPRAMREGFLESHCRAVELAGLTPELRADRAQALFVFERRFEEAEAELEQALRQPPKFANAYVRLAMLYATMGRLNDALDVVNEANAAYSLWPTMAPAEIFVLLCRGDFDAAVAAGRRAVELHPYLPLGRELYAQALECSGRVDEALEQYRLGCVMVPDLHWLRAVEGICLAKHGQSASAQRILDQLERLRETEYVDAYFTTLLLHALGRYDDSFRELERACLENSATLFLLDVDPRMDPLRTDPRFAPLRNKAFGRNPPSKAMASRV